MALVKHPALCMAVFYAYIIVLYSFTMWGFWYIIQTLRNTTTKETEMTTNYQKGLNEYNKRNAENSPFANKMKSILLAKSDTVGFFLIDGQVFRALVDVDGTPKNGVDVYGHPMDKRWECDHTRWQAFRSVFSWAEDVS